MHKKYTNIVQLNLYKLETLVDLRQSENKNWKSVTELANHCKAES